MLLLRRYPRSPPSPGRWIRTVLILALLCPAGRSARAQGSEGGDQTRYKPDATVVRLPVLIAGPPATYPPAALAAGLEAEVLLELDIDESGAVVAGRVVSPAVPLDPEAPPSSVADQGFEEAALEAARRFVFEPARDANGQAIPARIQYRTRFTVSTAPAAASQEPDGAEAPPSSTPPPSSGGREPGEEEPGEVFEVVGARARPETTERVLTMEQVQFLPGSGGDVVKAVQNLPGVNRAPLGTGQILIRGTAPEDSATTLDGLPLPIVFHFGGLNTVVTSEILEEVAFLPGNAGVRTGRVLAGTVDLRTDPSIPEESRGTLSVDLFQASAFIEQRLSDRTAVALSARRSYIDTVLSPVLSNATGTRFQAPRYSDVNARLLHRTPRGDVVDAFFVGSSDVFRVIGTDESTGDDETTIGLQTRFAKLRLLVRHVDDSGIRHETTLIAGPEEQAFQIAPDGDAFERPLDLAVRHELFRSPPGDPRDGSLGVGWRAGLDVQARRYRFLYDVPSFGVREEGDIGILAPAAYVEPTVRLSRWDLVLGLRADMITTDAGYTETSTDPRLSVRYHPGTRTRLKMSAGRFSRFPEPREVTPSADGNPDLTEEVAWQTSVGVEQDIAEAWRVELTAYDNHLQDLVSGNEDAFRFFSGPPPAGPLDTGPYANDGTGRSTGAELLVRFQADATLALLSATVSRSVRRKRPDSELVLFEYDQPVIVNALVSRDLPRNWKIGGRFRYGSGNPITPVVNRWFDADTGDWQPVYGTEQDRTPAFWQLDLRVDKSWELRTWTLSTFLDLQNATNHNNVEVVGYSDDYYTEEPVNGLPILPVFGVKGAW